MLSYIKSEKYLINTRSGGPSIPTMHYHNTYDLYYTLSGKRNYFVDDKFFTASAGDFILIKKGQLHRIGDGDVLRTLVSFTEEFLAQMYSSDMTNKLLKCFDNPLICPPEQEQEELKSLLKKMSNTSDASLFAVYLGELLLKLENCKENNSYNDRASDVLRYINQNYAEIQSLEQVANHLHLSKHYLCKLFKKAVGTTLIDYLNKVKIKNACTLLETTNQTLTEICHLCGFHSSSYFSTTFKNNLGISPLQYRLSYKEKERE